MNEYASQVWLLDAQASSRKFEDRPAKKMKKSILRWSIVLFAYIVENEKDT